MESTDRIHRASIWSRRTGQALSGLVALFMLFDGAIHIMKIAPVVDAFAQLGYPLGVAVPLGVLELAYTAVYVIPRTSALGAILLTAYLGGATATQVRVDAGLFPLLFPAILGVLVWAGLVLRDRRLQVLMPLQPS